MNESTTKKLIAFTDGAAEPNPGHGGAGFLVYHEGAILAAGGIYLGPDTTSNVAEYRGLIAALEAALAHGAVSVEVYADSRLVVQQVRGRWKVKSAHLRAYHDRALALLRHFRRWTLEWTPRENNAEADRLANTAALARHDVGLLDVEVQEAFYQSDDERNPANALATRDSYRQRIREKQLQLRNVRS